MRINIYRGQVVPNDFDDPNNANKVSDTSGKMPDTMKKMPDNKQEQQIYKYASENGSITTAETVELLGVKHRRARAVLKNMVAGGYLRKKGAARSTIYVKNTDGR